ncbi:MAG: ACP S-malonyltransferase [Treponema sp.]|jgi:[acyl-carrier-protein] S-malonyltransferase|nr:ACP S-malonyltransferase [Treponema sp.]
MTKKTVFFFPGQGAQYPGMALDLIEVSAGAKKVFETASEVLGRDMVKTIRDSDAETLKRTDVSQSAISAASLAAAAYLRECGIVPSVCAGFSLGEYPALACAGIISTEDCFRLTNERGRAMQAVVDKMQKEGGDAPGMAAVMGLAPEQVEALIADWKNSGQISDLYAANINSSVQTVVSGSAAALLKAENLFKEAGARRFLRLKVAGPFHSPFMKEAALAFAPALEKITFNDPAVALFSNVTGKQIKSGAEAKALCLRQITEGVRWTDEEAAIAELLPDLQTAEGRHLLLEVGPGKVLQGLWKDTGSSVPLFTAGTAAEISEITKLMEK